MKLVDIIGSDILCDCGVTRQTYHKSPLEDLIRAYLGGHYGREEGLQKAFAHFAGNLSDWDEFHDLLFFDEWEQNDNGDWTCGEWVWLGNEEEDYDNRLILDLTYEYMGA